MIVCYARVAHEVQPRFSILLAERPKRFCLCGKIQRSLVVVVCPSSISVNCFGCCCYCMGRHHLESIIDVLRVAVFGFQILARSQVVEHIHLVVSATLVNRSVLYKLVDAGIIYGRHYLVAAGVHVGIRRPTRNRKAAWCLLNYHCLVCSNRFKR